METVPTTPLAQLNGEISALAKEIRDKEAERKDEPDVAEKAILLASIADLKVEKAARSATRDALVLRLAPLAPAPAPGKNPPLTLDASAPSLYVNTQHPPLVVPRCAYV